MCKELCSKCNNELEPNRKGKQRYCKTCHNEHMKLNRPKHSELSDLQRKKSNARSYLNVYIRRGKIKRLPCACCGNPLSEGHHEDYDKPLEVVWLCRECHLNLHKDVV